jgi:predicted DNA binding CopG/RHH family protein
MENKIEKLREMQEDIEKLISDNEEASQVWQMFDNLVYKLEDIHEEQEKTEERIYKHD